MISNEIKQKLSTFFGCEKCTVWFKLYTTKTKKHTNGSVSYKNVHCHWQWYETNPHHTNTVLEKSVSSTMCLILVQKSFNSTKQFHLWSAIIGTQYNFRPVLVVKKVLCGSSCIWIDLKTVQMVQNKPTPHKYRPERYKTIPHHTNTVLKKSV